jgi:hypothetical protein
MILVKRCAVLITLYTLRLLLSCSPWLRKQSEHAEELASKAWSIIAYYCYYQHIAAARLPPKVSHCWLQPLFAVDESPQLISIMLARFS